MVSVERVGCAGTGVDERATGGSPSWDRLCSRVSGDLADSSETKATSEVEVTIPGVVLRREGTVVPDVCCLVLSLLVSVS